MAEFQWWLLLLGLVAGGGIVAVVYMDGARRDQDIDDDELPAEATWISEGLAARGRVIDAATVERVLLEHRVYRTEPPPDRIEGEGTGMAPSGGPESRASLAPLDDLPVDAPDAPSPGPTA